MTKSAMHLDEGESGFFSRQLEFIKTRSYDTKYKNLKAITLIPVSTEANSGADSITYRQFSAAGVAKIVSDYAKDFPRVDVYGVEVTVKVKSCGASFAYSIKEIRRAQMTGMPLDQRRASAAKRAIDELVDRLAWTGDTKAGIQGFLNYPGITEFTIPADGTGSSKSWSAKTGDQIVRDINGIITAVLSTTNGREQPDTLLLPLDQYTLISTKRMDGNSDKTVLKYIKENIPSLQLVEWLPELKGVGVGATNRIMVYVRDPEHLTLEMPQAFEQFEPEQEGMEFNVSCHAETAGVIVYYPQSVAFGDGV